MRAAAGESQNKKRPADMPPGALAMKRDVGGASRGVFLSISLVSYFRQAGRRSEMVFVGMVHTSCGVLSMMPREIA